MKRADAIRKMSDRRLAEFIRTYALNAMIALCDYVGINYTEEGSSEDNKEKTINDIIEWLNEEAT